MPDRLHFFCAPHTTSVSALMSGSRSGSGSSAGGTPIRRWEWQRRAFHHRMHDRIEYEEKLAYVRENPLRKNLVKNPDDWPFQGRVHDIQWIGD